MAYTYQKCSILQIEQTAEIILKRFANRRNGFNVDIEGIIEDLGITVLPRRKLRKLVNGYAPTDPRFIVIDESYGTHTPSYHSILAEEFCHILLEYDLLNKPIPKDARPHNLPFEQHKIIEQDAQCLALAILLPKDTFVQEWKKCMENAPSVEKSGRDKMLIYCAEQLEQKFSTWALKIAYRARDLGLISAEECRKCFSDRIPL